MKASRLKAPLDDLYARYNGDHAVADPIYTVRRFEHPADREVAAFCAAALAFGRVASVLQSIDDVFFVLGPSPAAFVRGFDPARHARRFRTLGHRWIRSRDLVGLIWILRNMLERGSIERFFLDGYDPDAPDVRTALESFSARARDIDLRPVYGRVPARPGAHFFFARPSSGSACKRLNMFLRWMVRRDEVDLGQWSGVRRSQLVVPLDTHIARVGRCLRLTRRVTPGWAMAADITNGLRAIDAEDPVKYDFALCHIGMAGLCRFGQPRRKQPSCPLTGCCRP